MGSSSPNKSSGSIFDPIRQITVVATPEEQVRQALLCKMMVELSFPKELLVVERTLKELPHLLGVSSLPDRRADILCFASKIHPIHSFYPLLLVECKQTRLDQKAIDQLLGYNCHVKAYFIALAAPNELLFGYPKEGEFAFLPFLPSYQQLLDALKVFL